MERAANSLCKGASDQTWCRYQSHSAHGSTHLLRSPGEIWITRLGKRKQKGTKVARQAEFGNISVFWIVCEHAGVSSVNRSDLCGHVLESQVS